MVTRINMLILMEKDLDAAMAFYRDLGLDVVFHMQGKWAEMSFPDGVKLGLCPTDEDYGDRRTGMVFEVADMQSVCASLPEQGSVVNEPVERSHGIMASVKDPGGNIIDLYQPTPEKLKDLVKKASQCECADGKACACLKQQGACGKSERKECN